MSVVELRADRKNGEGRGRETEPRRMRLISIRYAAADCNVYEFAEPDGEPLLAYEAGAHIDLHLPSGVIRQYSLCAPYGAGRSYAVGVKLDRASKGGSRYIHQNLRVGDILEIGGPRNNFPLHPGNAPAILIAGGIGVTPIWCMAQTLNEARRPFALHYAVRTKGEAAFLAEMAALLGPRLHLHVDEHAGGELMNIKSIVDSAPSSGHFYCCGPLPMMASFEEAAASLPASQKHVEYFSPPEAPAVEGGFVVVLARSGRELEVPAGKTILEVLRAAGVDAAASCEQGVCGACETNVISGRPDHRDVLLTDDEKAAGRSMMICCSGSLDPKLVLDL